jgi:hypothetical protein
MIELEFEDGLSVTTPVTPLGDDQYRLEETEWVADLNHHDVIHAEYLGATRLRFRGVTQRSDLLPRSAILPKDFLESAEVLSALGWLSQQGGYWQRDLGGCLILSIPKEVERAFRDRWEHVIDLHLRRLTHPGEPVGGRTISFTQPLDAFRKTDSPNH